MEWCFCKSSPGRQDQPCNGASQESLARLNEPYYEYKDQEYLPTKVFRPINSRHRESRYKPRGAHSLSINLKKIDRPLDLVKKGELTAFCILSHHAKCSL